MCPTSVDAQVGEYWTWSLQSRSKHFDFGGIDSRIHHHPGGEARDRLSPVLEQQRVHAGREGDVGHRLGPVFVVHNLRFSRRTCKKNQKKKLSNSPAQSGGGDAGTGASGCQVGLGGTNWDLLDLPGLELLGLLGGESRAASRLSCPGPAREQSTLTTLVSPTCTNTPESQIRALEIQIKWLFPDKDRSLT